MSGYYVESLGDRVSALEKSAQDDRRNMDVIGEATIMISRTTYRWMLFSGVVHIATLTALVMTR